MASLSISDGALGCVTIIGVFGIIALFVCHLVYLITFLIQDWNDCVDCDRSSLNIYLIVMTALMDIFIGSSFTLFTADYWLGFSFLGIYVIVDIIWGAIELFDKSCDYLKETDLYKFAEVRFYSLAVIYVLLLIVPLIIRKFENDEKNKRKTQPAHGGQRKGQKKRKMTTKQHIAESKV